MSYGTNNRNGSNYGNSFARKGFGRRGRGNKGNSSPTRENNAVSRQPTVLTHEELMVHNARFFHKGEYVGDTAWALREAQKEARKVNGTIYTYMNNGKYVKGEDDADSTGIFAVIA